jgi:hypothetical protein
MPKVFIFRQIYRGMRNDPFGGETFPPGTAESVQAVRH